jgi:hypothetical protein
VGATFVVLSLGQIVFTDGNHAGAFGMLTGGSLTVVAALIWAVVRRRSPNRPEGSSHP